jgi:hypothetical protein
MSETLAIRSEILKLARLLERDPESLSYLEAVPPGDIRALRELVTERLYDAGGGAISTLATASKVIPPGLTATLAQRTFGPVLSARVAGELDPARAVEVARKLPPDFVADIAIELDPRRAHAVIGRIPAELAGEVARELIRRGEYVTMGRLVGHIAPDALQSSLQAMSDSDLLEVAFVLEDRSALEGLIGELGVQRLAGVLTAAADEGLWPEALDLFGNLSPEQAQVIAEAAARVDDRVLESLVAAAQEHEVSDALLALVPRLPPDAQERIAALLPAGVQLSDSEVRSRP